MNQAPIISAIPNKAATLVKNPRAFNNPSKSSITPARPKRLNN